MIFFKQFVEIFNNANRFTISGMPTSAKDALDISKSLLEAKVFVVLPPKEKEMLIDSYLPLFSLPFKVCWFEPLKEAPSVDGKNGWRFIILGILVTEDLPGAFSFAILIKRIHELGSETAILTTRDGWDLTTDAAFIHAIAKQYVFSAITRINKTDAIGSASTKESIKIKTAHGKVHHKIRKIIYIVPKKGRETADLGREVDWTHRWLVRGHWRKINGLGKDREGIYCVKDFTWVTDHEKGPEDLPLVADKVRVLRDRNE